MRQDGLEAAAEPTVHKPLRRCGGRVSFMSFKASAGISASISNASIGPFLLLADLRGRFFSSERLAAFFLRRDWRAARKADALGVRSLGIWLISIASNVEG